MKTEVSIYFSALTRYIPLYVWVASFLVCALIVLYRYKKEKKFKVPFLQTALVEYYFLVLCSTVLFRPEKEEIEYMFQPFWKYWIAFRFANLFGIWEIIMNIVLFIPIGFLAPVLLRSFNFIRNEFARVVVVGMLMSLSIELLQLVLRRGMCETDDLTHNTLGCIIGYGLYRLTKNFWLKE